MEADFIGACKRKAMTPPKLWTLLFDQTRDTGEKPVFYGCSGLVGVAEFQLKFFITVARLQSEFWHEIFCAC